MGANTQTSRILLAALMATSAGVPTVLHAQTVTPPTSDPIPAEAAATDAAATDGRQLGDIIVTARKKSESLTTVPLSITAVTAGDIAARGIKTVQDLASFTPGLRNQNQSVGRNDRGFKQYVIRGIVPGSASSTRQTVTVFVDGAPVAGGNVEGVTDIERVEVVRGPQSAFFGRSTFAGAINFVTRAPSYDWHASANGELARFGTVDASGQIEGPIVRDVLAFRLAAHEYHTDGAYRDQVYPSVRLGRRNTQSFSGSLRFDPANNLHIRAFGVHWEDHDGLPANARYNRASFNCNAGAAPTAVLNYRCGALTATPVGTQTWNQTLLPVALQAIQSGYTLFGPKFIERLGLERHASQARINFDWTVSDWTLSGIGSYDVNKWGYLQTPFGYDLRNIPSVGSAPLPYSYTATAGQTRDEDHYGELRLATPKGGRLSGLIGANYLSADYETNTTAYGGTGLTVVTAHQLSHVQTIGIFGSATFNFTDQLLVTGEARYQWDKQSQKVFSGTNPFYQATFKSFTPRAVLQYKPNSRSTLYASYSIGNRPGEFNAGYYAQNAYVQAQINQQANVQGTVPEDKLHMGEIGYKGQVFDNRLRILVSAYYGMWTDRHIPSTVLYYATPAAQTSGVQSQLTITSPAGKVQLYGGELELTFKATPNLTLEGTFGYAHTNIRKTFSSDSLALTGNASPVGTQLPYYPETQGSVSATYERAVSAHVTPFVRGDVFYTDRLYDSESNIAYTPRAVTANLRVGAQIDNYRVELFGTNITNNKTPTSLARVAYNEYAANGSSTSANGLTVSLPDPAVYGARVSVKF